MIVAETSIVKKNHQIPHIINQKIAQKLIEKTSMTDITHQLSISTSTVEFLGSGWNSALQLPYSNSKLEATNNLIKLIKRNAFGFRNFENFKTRILIALNIKKERTKLVLSRL